VYYYYIRPPNFNRIDFNDIIFKTGDLILFKSFNSYIPLISVIDYCHIGIIIVIDHEPFVLEMYNPCAYMTPILHKLLENDGGIIYYKSLKAPLSEFQLQKINAFLQISSHITYREYMHENNTESKDYNMVCTEFIFHLLCDACIISRDKYDGSFLLNYLGNLNNIYDELKYIVFFNSLRRYSIDTVLSKAINGINVKAKTQEILNMPLINDIWKKQYIKYNPNAKFNITKF
jgi:hypothetical protein